MSCICFRTDCVHLSVNVIDCTNIARNVQYQIGLLVYSYCSNIQDNIQISNTSLITLINCAIFIKYIYCFCYVFRSTTLHHQGELRCPLLKIACCYAAIICGQYSSCITRYERHKFAFSEFTTDVILTAV